jgi:hypothetical protein
MRAGLIQFTRHHTVGTAINSPGGRLRLKLASACRVLLEMTAEDLVEFETLLSNDDAVSPVIAEMRLIGRQLAGIGADILEQPIPDAFVEALLGAIMAAEPTAESKERTLNEPAEAARCPGRTGG